jgi:hypothetical protein
MEDKEKDVVASHEVIPAEQIPTDEMPIEAETGITPFEGDYMNVTIEVADNLVKYEKAVDAIMNFIVRRCYAGDFVSHDKASTPLDERKVNIIGAAAERIARDLGIQESNRTKPEKKWFDQAKHPGHYYYECEGDFTFRGRKVHAVGNASTLNPFYSREYGAEKSPDKIREEYIMRECWRDCVKQGIKMWFGLRAIPITKLKELGYDISKVKFVNFGQNKDSQAAKNPEATAKPAGTEAPVADSEAITITIEAVTAKTSKNGKSFYSVKDAEGVNYYAWGDAQSDLIVKLNEAWKVQKPVSVMVKPGQYPTITAVVSK